MKIVGINDRRDVEIGLGIASKDCYVKLAGEEVHNIVSIDINVDATGVGLTEVTIKLAGIDAEAFLKLRQVKFEVVSTL